MIRYHCIPIFVVLLSNCLPCTAIQTESHKIADTIGLSGNKGKIVDTKALVVTIDIWADEINAGCGFVSGDGRYIATNYHNVDCCNEFGSFIGLKSPYVISRYWGDISKARIIAADPELDVAILELPWNKHPALTLANEQEVLNTDNVSISSYNIKRVFTEGKIDLCTDWLLVTAAGIKHNKPRMLLMEDDSQRIEQGWSGSPVISSKTGNVIGVLSGIVDDIGMGRPATARCTANQLAEIASKINEPKSGKHLQASTENSKEAFSNIILYFAASTLDDQIKYAKEFIKLRPSSAYAHMLLAQSAFYNDQIDLAWQHYKKALTLGPCEAGIHFSYARFLESSRPKDAAIEYKKALALDPRDIEGLRDCLSLLIKLGRKSEAEFIAHQAAQRQPSIAEIWSVYSNVMEQLKKPEEAATLSEKAVKLVPMNPAYRLTLADLLAQLGRLDDAQTQYAALLKLAPDDPRIWYAYAEFICNYKKQDYQLALDALDKASALNKSSIISAEKIDKLRKRISE
ncbi:tetratricopeptide repeat protein [bacterium]|nr:tetratricopeptide repeat protein [bacterium]